MKVGDFTHVVVATRQALDGAGAGSMNRSST
jgi:hypothetical protein